MLGASFFFPILRGGDRLGDTDSAAGQASIFNAEAIKATAGDSFQADKYDRVLSDAYSYIVYIAQHGNDLPEYGSPKRDIYLASLWRSEPIMSSAVYAMVAKVGGWEWTLTGGRNSVSRFMKILNDAEAGKGWQTFIQRFAQDALTTDRGGFVEIGRPSDSGPVTALYNMDALRCRPTGNSDWPVVWRDGDGKWVPIPAGLVVHQAILPSARDEHHGIGFCPVSRAVRSAQVLLLIQQYDAQKLSTLPPEGIGTVSGMGMEGWLKALNTYKAHKENRSQSVYPGILWLLGGGVGAAPEVKVELIPFSSLPEQFDRKLVVEIYVKTLAIAFGVDVAEFWQIEHSGATKAATAIQHEKAKGKGSADLAMGIERWMNWDVLSAGVQFAFDRQDDEHDMQQAEYHKAVTEYITKLAYPAPGVAEGLIDRDEARQLLAKYGVLPEDVIQIGEITMEDTDKFMAELAWRRGEEIVVVNRHNRILSAWPARKVFVPGDFAVRRFVNAPAVTGPCCGEAAKTVEEEVATLPLWRKADLGEWNDELHAGLNTFMDDVDERVRAWVEDEDDHPIQTDEEGVAI